MLSSPLTKKKYIYTVRKIEKRVRRRRRDWDWDWDWAKLKRTREDTILRQM